MLMRPGLIPSQPHPQKRAFYAVISGLKVFNRLVPSQRRINAEFFASVLRVSPAVRSASADEASLILKPLRYRARIAASRMSPAASDQ